MNKGHKDKDKDNDKDKDAKRITETLNQRRKHFKYDGGYLPLVNFTTPVTPQKVSFLSQNIFLPHSFSKEYV